MSDDFATFHNRLRKLLNIDFHQLVDAQVMTDDEGGRDEWAKFSENPWRWFIRADDERAERVWAIMEKPR